MKQQWAAINAKVQALSKRERILILVSIFAVVWKVFDVTVFSALAQKSAINKGEIVTQQEELTKLTQQEVNLLKSLQADPTAKSKARLAELKERTAQMDAEIELMGRDLVKPDSMPYVLESVLQRYGQIKLVSLKTLPVTGLLDGNLVQGAQNASGPLMGIYKHGFQITLEGSYFELLHYVTALEVSPWRTLWGNVGLNAGSYPKSTLTLTVYTLSLDKVWMSL